MRLLKIGSLDYPHSRWLDALSVFSEIDIFCFEKEEKIDNPKFCYMMFQCHGLNKFFYKVAMKFSHAPSTKFFCEIIIFFARLYNRKLLNSIKKTEYDYIHSSYNDYDESAYLTCLLNPDVFTRAQKETRLQYSYFEEWNFLRANRVILNDKENQKFYEKKYSLSIFNNKELILGLDEDVRSKDVKGCIEYHAKLSESDSKIHAVILAGRVLSTPDEPRSGGRLYYIPVINELLNAGIVVHLHTGNIVPFDGKDPYHELAEQNHDFIIEEKLDFEHDTKKSYNVLSRYDVGICHAHIPGYEVTEFDRVNIPHRYYEYHLAHVVPIDIVKKNILLDKKAKCKQAVTVDNYRDITYVNIKDINWDIPDFYKYVSILYAPSDSSRIYLM